MAEQVKTDFHILICLIRIWDADIDDLMTIPPKVDMITEVQTIETTESYEQVIDTAKIKFPKGTLLRTTIAYPVVDKIDEEDQIVMNQSGVVEVRKAGSKVASAVDFSVGRRIKIQFGYTTDPLIAAMTKVKQNNQNIYNNSDMFKQYTREMNYEFDGFITQCGLEEPLEIKCEDLGHMTRRRMCDKVGSAGDLGVNDFLAEDGKYHWLDDTGLTLLDDTKKADIKIGRFAPDRVMSVFELLTSWGKRKLNAFVVIKNGKPCLAVAKSYFTDIQEDSVIKVMSKIKNSDTPVIDFSYNVANNGLTLSRIDPLKLAVKASGYGKDNKHFHLVAMLNPDYLTGKSDKKFRIVGASTFNKKSKKKYKGTDKIDLKGYTVIQYQSTNPNTTKETLEKEAKDYFESYNRTGLEGTLTLFGDYGSDKLYSGGTVILQDDRQPAKNGKYVVGEIVTKFGVQGYRRIIKLPYCLELYSNSSNE